MTERTHPKLMERAVPGEEVEYAAGIVLEGPVASPMCIIAYIGEDLRKYTPLIAAARDAASTNGARLIFYDADAASRFGSPTTTFWSGDRDRDLDGQVDGKHALGAADLEAAGRGAIARLVLEARAAGIDAFGWLPRSRGAHDLGDYAKSQHADLIILPAHLDHVPMLEKLFHGTAPARKIMKETVIPIVRVELSAEHAGAPA